MERTTVNCGGHSHLNQGNWQMMPCKGTGPVFMMKEKLEIQIYMQRFLETDN